jgi:hypothetical protein
MYVQTIASCIYSSLNAEDFHVKYEYVCLKRKMELIYVKIKPRVQLTF